MANLAQTINHILKTLKNHIGRGGNVAHLPVDNDMSGFMTPEMLGKLEGANGSYQIKDNVNDILKLPIGNWLILGTKTNNAPMDSGWHFVSIKGDAGGRRQFSVQHSHTGMKWTCGWSANGEAGLNPLKWRKEWQTKVLFAGSMKLIGDSFQIEDSFGLYEYVEFYYSYLGVMYSHKVSRNTITRKLPFELGGLKLDQSIGSRGVSFGRIILRAPELNKLVVDGLEANYFPGTGEASTSTDGDKIDIYRVIGWF